MILRSLLIVTLALLARVSPAVAQSAPAVRGIARELVEALGQRSARELAEAGGEAAAREVVEKAAREGGEQLAREVAAYGQRYGAQALRAFGEAPAAMAGAMKRVPSELAESAMRAAAREPQAIARLTAQFGEDALIVAAKHPGLGVDIGTKLGREGLSVARNLSTPDAIRLARLGDDLARLPAAERAGLLARMKRAPGKVIDYLEKHPRVLTSAAAVTAAYIAIDALLGDVDSPGFLERIATTFKNPLTGVLWAIAGLLLARMIWWWRRSRRAVPGTAG